MKKVNVIDVNVKKVKQSVDLVLRSKLSKRDDSETVSGYSNLYGLIDTGSDHSD
jgi:hypothetical protein